MEWITTGLIVRDVLPLTRTAAGAMLFVVLLSVAACSLASGQTEDTIVDEWTSVAAPPPPELNQVTVAASKTALLILDIQKQNCSAERSKRMPVVYTLTSNASEEDIREEVARHPDEPVVKSSVDKFYGTDLEGILKSLGVGAVVLVGTSAHGAVLHTATGAALRGFEVIVPVDGMSAGDPYAEQYTAWHLANSPGTRRRATLTSISMIEIQP